MLWHVRAACLHLCCLVTMFACAPSTPTGPVTASEITLYDWAGDIPEEVVRAFTEEFGVHIHCVTYESQEEAIESMRAGVAYDVVVMESRFIPLLVAEGLLAPIKGENVPNFKNISPGFRDLAYDPGNRYSVPYTWGVTGLIVRTDLTLPPVQHWADLWDKRHAGRIGIWMGQRREVIAIALKSLGYSGNSENPAELSAALDRLLALKPSMVVLEDIDPEDASAALASEQVTVAMGYASDFSAAKEKGLSVEFVYPEEGALLWGDVFVIPARNHDKLTAEAFVNYLLRPEVAAQIVNLRRWATANEAARAHISSEVLSDPTVYPPIDWMRSAELILPLSAAGQRLYDRVWRDFVAGD